MATGDGDGDGAGQVLGEVGFVPSTEGTLEMGYWVAAELWL